MTAAGVSDSRARESGILTEFPEKTIAVLGDVILDEYIYGRVSRISPEAPVPVLEVESRTQTLGGAGNVARNIASLGGHVQLFSIVGNDDTADRFVELAREGGIGCEGIVVAEERPTTLKQRVAARTQQIVRIDSETVKAIAAEHAEELGRRIEGSVRHCHALVISDYDKGVITADLLHRAVDAFRAAGKPVVVDPNVLHFYRYGDATVVTPNHLQLERVSGRRIRNEEELFETARAVREKLGRASLLVTRGEAGMALINDEGILKIPTVAREVYDVTGAGDTVVAALGLALACGASLPVGARIANAAAGIVVGKRGTAVASREELDGKLRDLGQAHD